MNGIAISWREAVRGFIRHKSFFAVAVLTSALGIGIGTTVFCVLYTVLLRPLSYGDASRLVVGRASYEGASSTQNRFNGQALLNWREAARTFDGLTAFKDWEFTLLHQGEPGDLEAVKVAADFFSVLGVQARIGAVFSPELARAEDGRVVMLSYALWRRRFGADPAIVGKAINLSGEIFSVAGIMPKDFDVPSQDVAVWAPLPSDPAKLSNEGNLIVIGRLRPAVSLAQAEAEAAGVALQLAADYPDTHQGMTIYLVPFFEELVKDSRPLVLATSAAALLVFLICCANLSGLLLARAIARRSEFATRLAIGARRPHLLGVVFCESLLLAVCGGIIGAGLARWMISALVRLAPIELPRYAAIGEGLQLPLVAAGLAVAAAVLIALAPAWEVARFEPSAETGKGSRSTSRRFARQVIVAAELAIALTLLTGTGLMARTILSFRNADIGWKTDHLLDLQIYLPTRNYPERHQVQQFFETFIGRLRARPEVVSVAASTSVPPGRKGIDFDLPIQVPGRSEESAGRAHLRVVTSGFFATMGIPLLQGRDFDDRDRDPQTLRIIVNQRFARKYFPDSPSVVGKQVTIFFGPPQAYDIIGVVGDVHHYGLLEDPRPEFYLSFASRPFTGMGVVVRTAGDPLAFVPEFRRQLWALDPELPIESVASMEQRVAYTWRDRSLLASLMVFFAATAVALTVLGVYSVVTFSVNRQAKEIGIRMAMGARRNNVVRLVVGQSARAIAAGVALGLLGAWMLGRGLASVIYGVSATDPWILLGGAIGVSAIAALGAWLPSRRAAKIDPMLALRVE
jgi:predicted permease